MYKTNRTLTAKFEEAVIISQVSVGQAGWQYYCYKVSRTLPFDLEIYIVYSATRQDQEGNFWPVGKTVSVTIPTGQLNSETFDTNESHEWESDRSINITLYHSISEKSEIPIYDYTSTMSYPLRFSYTWNSTVYNFQINDYPY